MFSIYTSRIKSWRNKKSSAKNNKNETFYKYIQVGRNTFSIRKRWLEKNEKNNVTIALNILYAEKEKIYSVYVSKHNSNREKQVILVMFPSGEGWYFCAALLICLYKTK